MNEVTNVETVAVTVYSRPGCVQCKATYRALTSAGIGFEVVNVDDSPAAAEYVKRLGYLALPVVVVDDGTSWNQFRPDLIEQLRTSAA